MKIFAKHYLGDSAESMAHTSGLSADFRIYLIAVDRMNRLGHAHFDKGVLEAALPDVKSRRTLHAAIDRLVKAGKLAPESDIRCLIVNSGEVYHRLNKRGRQCPRNCHKKFYHDGDWIHPQELGYGSNHNAEWARSVREDAEARQAASEAGEARALSVLRALGGDHWWTRLPGMQKTAQ